ncbi:Bug family tripartite tricarboxylate transporter substrate binding protein, partial [Streptomyces albidoflavus]|uniref:Bug family tripartite tricarboxylate transporter substrate binding protein n=1 Tax=Streptomyces albidoflavus TaxID=1886 RepID=UPI003F4E245E
MMVQMRKLFFGAAVAAALLVNGIAPVPAQDFPTKPITVVVPFSAGGPTDTLIRTLGERMRESLGQSVLIENVTGAAGTIGVGRVARAPGDG